MVFWPLVISLMLCIPENPRGLRGRPFTAQWAEAVIQGPAPSTPNSRPSRDPKASSPQEHFQLHPLQLTRTGTGLSRHKIELDKVP